MVMPAINKVFSPGHARQEEINRCLEDLKRIPPIQRVPGHPGHFRRSGTELAFRRGIQMGQEDAYDAIISEYPDAAKRLLDVFQIVK